MEVDLSPLVQLAVTLAGAAITAGVSVLVPLIVRKLRAAGIEIDQAQAAAIQGVADVGAQAAYGFIAKQGAKITDVTVRNQAIAIGAQHVIDSLPGYLASQGVTREHVEKMVEARLGGLLAADPTVSVGGGSPAPSGGA